ncbi:hypothetical protein AB1K54_09190 [Microbacterium sp. BWT-B31]|uniref:hypothetical protein n=1 Tax=Microbacterium sp. BWT-B31 TaxID=3232072 RepID=UPI00352784D7
MTVDPLTEDRATPTEGEQVAASAEEPRSNKRRSIIITAIVAVLVLIAAGVAVPLVLSAKAHDEALAAYSRAQTAYEGANDAVDAAHKELTAAQEAALVDYGASKALLGRVAKGAGEPVECRGEAEAGVVVAGGLV